MKDVILFSINSVNSGIEVPEQSSIYKDVFNIFESSDNYGDEGIILYTDHLFIVKGCDMWNIIMSVIKSLKPGFNIGEIRWQIKKQ